MSKKVDWDARGRALEAVWSDAESLNHAFDLAEIGIKDRRERQRARARLVALGYNLPILNEQHCSDTHTECPSTLDFQPSDAYIITSHTNNSPIDDRFWNALHLFAADKGAQMLVVPVNYLNLGVMHKHNNYQWDSRVYPYVALDDLDLSDKLMLSATRIIATAKQPLTGVEVLGQQKDTIFGHPQLAMRSIAAHPQDIPKIIHTTGSINEPVYSATKAGKIADLNHHKSALYVQILDGQHYITQLVWDGNGFNYFEERWATKKRLSNRRIAALVMGDFHAYWARPDVMVEREGVIHRTNPEALVWHDLHDHHSQNHHHTKLDRIAVAQAGDDLVEQEIILAVNFVNQLGAGRMNYIVQSNHDDALTRWLNRFRDDQDARNAPFYWELMAKVLENPNMSPLELAMADYLEVDYQFVGRNDACWIEGIDCSQHGDVGANGVRRVSPVTMAKAKHKTSLGHSHTPCIEKGCWVSGTSTDRMTYRKGYTSWGLADHMIYQGGERAMIFYEANYE